MVWKIKSDNTVEVAEVLGTDGCKITWGGYNNGYGYNTVDEILANATFIAKAPKTETSTQVTTIFDANGGSCSTTSMDYATDSCYGMLPTPTRAGYTFLGWWPEASSASQEYAIERNVCDYDHTLYALWGIKYNIINAGAGRFLTYDTSLGEIGNGVNVQLSSSNSILSASQQWLIPFISNKTVIKCQSDVDFGLNVRTDTNNCTLHRVFKNETNAIISVVSSGSYYKIKLYNYDLYLTAESNAANANVYWAPASSNSLQLWDFNEVVTGDDC